jgi:hypothetical protein
MSKRITVKYYERKNPTTGLHKFGTQEYTYLSPFDEIAAGDFVVVDTKFGFSLGKVALVDSPPLSNYPDSKLAKVISIVSELRTKAKAASEPTKIKVPFQRPGDGIEDERPF